MCSWKLRHVQMVHYGCTQTPCFCEPLMSWPMMGIRMNHLRSWWDPRVDRRAWKRLGWSSWWSCLICWSLQLSICSRSFHWIPMKTLPFDRLRLELNKIEIQYVSQINSYSSNKRYFQYSTRITCRWRYNGFWWQFWLNSNRFLKRNFNWKNISKLLLRSKTGVTRRNQILFNNTDCTQIYLEGAVCVDYDHHLA